ncbi:uncharacterized protein [Procambarus clarkii]|uniref:uncharacterized protein n=1 Tax=Procambarus clarkii TaxID=6728 RepID=UPI001E6788F4|nr:uncharacterized protein LOC123746698 [Procambarus clarkii]
MRGRQPRGDWLGQLGRVQKLTNGEPSPGRDVTGPAAPEPASAYQLRVSRTVVECRRALSEFSKCLGCRGSSETRRLVADNLKNVDGLNTGVGVVWDHYMTPDGLLVFLHSQEQNQLSALVSSLRTRSPPSGQLHDCSVTGVWQNYNIATDHVGPLQSPLKMNTGKVANRLR